jgi:surface polysaccharide O-acyltransferase-like enzyme
VTERIDSLDTLKGLAIFFVVFIHSQPFFSSNQYAELFTYIIANLSRLAVPAFFLTSGFLLSLKLKEKGKDYEKEELEKIGRYYIIASLAYLPFSIGAGYLQEQRIITDVIRPLGPQLTGLEGLFNFLYLGKGIGDFLWFFPALFFSIALIHLFYKHERVKELLIGSIILHSVSILSNAYQIIDLPIPVEDTLFFGLVFTTSGFVIGKKKLKELRSGNTFLILFIFFFLFHQAERAFITFTVNPLDVYYWNPYFWGPYSFFTAPMAVTFFLYVLNRPKWGKKTRLENYGRHSLLGYLIHPAVIGIFVGLSIGLKQILGVTVIDTLVWDLLFFPLAYVLTMEVAIRARGVENRLKNQIDSNH